MTPPIKAPPLVATLVATLCMNPSEGILISANEMYSLLWWTLILSLNWIVLKSECYFTTLKSNDSLDSSYPTLSKNGLLNTV